VRPADERAHLSAPMADFDGGSPVVSMVVGIFSDQSALQSIVDGLAAKGVDLERLRIVSCDEIPTDLATTGIQYTWIGDVNRGAEGSIMTSGGGTSMPSGDHGSGVFDGDINEMLSDLAVPDGRTDEYALAVERGAHVVGYPCLGIDAATLRALFDSSGASSIEEF
jgi:hypothetical protein